MPAGAMASGHYAHGSGSSRSSPRNVWVAGRLQQAGLATLLFDLLTSGEEARDLYTRQHRFDIGLLAKRLAFATRWIDAQPELASLPLGLFGASTGAAAALVVASELGNRVAAVVSRGGRPDLAADSLAKVKSPTLLVVGGADDVVLDLNRRALALLESEKRLEIVPGATHLFEEPGALERVAELAADWLVEFLIVENAR
jgi:dienelactone hydrolase